MTLLDDPPRCATADAVVDVGAAWSWVHALDASSASLAELREARAVLARLRSRIEARDVRLGAAAARLVEAAKPKPQPGSGEGPQPKPKPEPPQPGGMSAAEARRQRDAQVGARLAPSFADALERGDVSVDHLMALGRVRNAADVPAAESVLLAAAIVRSADEFSMYLKNWDTARDQQRGVDVAAQRRARRGLSFFTDDLSMGGTRVVLEPVAHAEVKDAILRAADQLWRSGDRTSTAAQRMADALHLLVTGSARVAPAAQSASSESASFELASTEPDAATRTTPTAPVASTAKRPARPARTTLVVFIDEDSLFGRLDAAGYATTVDGIRLTVTEARMLAVDADILPMVLGGNGQVLDMGRRRRNTTGNQSLALLAQYCGCVVAGCNAPPLWLQDHHGIEWERGGPTDIATMWPYCGTHHRMHHANGWIGRAADGRVQLTDAHGTIIPTRNRRGPTPPPRRE